MLMIDNNQRKKIMHRRWLIVAIVMIILIIWLDLWEFILLIFELFLFGYLLWWIVKWLTGMDIDDRNLREVNKNRAKKGLPPVNTHEGQEDHGVSDTLWDIFTLNQIFNHHGKD